MVLYGSIDVDPDQPICITIRIDNSHRNPALHNWYHKKIKPSSDLHRYVHERDGSICQTLFLPQRFMEQESVQKRASLMLVNNWYKPASNYTPSLLYSFKTNGYSSPNKEKAVGKLHVECLYIETIGDKVPEDMDSVINSLNAKRFHQTIWQSGYMTQLGGRNSGRVSRM